MARRDRFSDGLVRRAQLLFAARLKRDISLSEARLMLGDLTDFYELAFVRMERLKRNAASDTVEPPEKAGRVPRK
jgi:hypothetical protein